MRKNRTAGSMRGAGNVRQRNAPAPYSTKVPEFRRASFLIFRGLVISSTVPPRSNAQTLMRPLAVVELEPVADARPR